MGKTTMSKTRCHLRPKGFPPQDQEMGYSYGLQVGDTIWVTGQIARNERGECVGPNDPEAQAVQVFRNIAAVLAEADATLDDVVQLTIFIKDPSVAKPVQQVRKRMFKAGTYPTAALVLAPLPIPDYLMEIQAVAVVER
jgi:2-iminobutanoate/2-iminopropanoate deaminase